MEGRVKRRYNSPTRREQATGTRRHVLAAAARVFAERGYGRTTMEAIAAAAEVGVATVYANFGTKAALVEALIKQVTGDENLDVHLVLDEPNLERALERAALNIRKLHERSVTLTDLLRSARGHEPVLEVLWRGWQEGHLAAMRLFSDWLGSLGVLRQGLRPNEAADILYALAGAETYRELVQERGWSPRRYQAWLAETGKRLLFDTSASL
jgi:AcrR family transcriptional regulator